MICNAIQSTDPLAVSGFLYERIRRDSLKLCAPLQIDDYGVQSMPDTSPIKWHLAHTTWFFEQFILEPEWPNYRPLDRRYAELFNSYYHSFGCQHPRARRGVLSRPTVPEILHYRRHVDEQMQHLLAARTDDENLMKLITLGLHHEQQHQELMLADIKHAFASNPILPVYRERSTQTPESTVSLALQFTLVSDGIRSAGAEDGDFSFDNERPRHRIVLEPFALANRLVTNEEYLAFVRTGGYRRADLWLADGWDAVKSEGWSRPLYWQESLDSEFTLHGVDALVPSRPVCHLSYYEADAFARWAGMRLPTEFEWETVARDVPVDGNFVESGRFHPQPAQSLLTTLIDAQASPWTPHQLFGDVWEWTASAYSPYPGYAAPRGALGEYNGKFMSGQMVLRGGSCASAREHIRATYRNFFHPKSRWQFAGVRVAR